jgi:hypothetical protein
MPPPNEIQLKQINEVKSTVDRQKTNKTATSAVSLVHWPPRQTSLYQKVSPKVDAHYCRPVLALVPDLNFPGLEMLCPSCRREKLLRHGWADITAKRKRAGSSVGPVETYRYIHGIYEGYYLVQARYICNDKINCKATTTAYNWLESDVCPDHVRLALKIFTLSHESGLMQEVKDMLMTDAMSPKSFEDIQLFIKTMRNTQYLRRRALYYASVTSFVASHGTITADQFKERAAFSAIDDSRGYNEDLGPSAGYLIEFFKGKRCASSQIYLRLHEYADMKNLFSSTCDSSEVIFA